MRVIYAILIDRSSIDKFHPVFEIISLSEFIIHLLCMSMLPFLVWITLNAAPLHRNLRFAFILCILKGFAGSISRSILLFAQHFFDNFEDHHNILIVASLIRRSFYTFFVAMLVCITTERLVATFYWSWYEKQAPSTIIVFLAIFAFAEIFAGMMACNMTYRKSNEIKLDYRAFILGICMLFMIVGGIAYAFLLHYNQRELRKLHRKAADFDRYSLSRTYQFKENVVVMKMLYKMAFPFFTSVMPACACYLIFCITPKVAEFEFVRMLSAAIFDLWVQLVCCICGLCFPFFDIRFGRVAAKMAIFRRIRKKRSKVSVIAYTANRDAAMTADSYFNWLEEDWRVER